ncbi:Rho GTPase-activating protein 1, partial [Goodea atripinnis]
FGRKINYVSYLSELEDVVKCEQLVIPTRVSANSDVNKMTNSNLAVVFGPNLLWGRDNAMSLSAIGPINNFTRTLLDQQHLVFT